MDNISNVIIGNNLIKYQDKTLKVSNISRTWIFRFQNIEKQKFEEKIMAYNNEKARYERNEAQKKKTYIRSILFAVGVFLFISIIGFMNASFVIGFIFICIAGVLALEAYRIHCSDINYPYPPPIEEKYPDKYGLGIEMNSGYKAIFAAIGDEGIRALRKLQSDVEEADVTKNIIHFNMNDYNITVENNDGIINTGDYANNLFQDGGQAAL